MFRISVFNLFWTFMFCFVAADDMKCYSPHSENLTDSSQDALINTLLNNAKDLIEAAKNYAARNRTCPLNESQINKPVDCAEILEKDPHAKSGVHKIWPRSRVTKGPINVYCDMDDDGGAWTVIQRRGEFGRDKDYFYKDWNEYKIGFGELQEDHWLGNDNICALTNQRPTTVKFTLSDWEEDKRYAIYDDFWIEDELRKYTVHGSGYKGTAGDSFKRSNGSPFSTKDQDNDSYGNHCAVQFKGAWWYSNCHDSNLNGMYLKGSHESFADGVEWRAFKGYNYSLKDTVIKIRPKDFIKRSWDATPQ